MSAPTDDKSTKGKFNINIGSVGSIGSQHIGDVYANSYNVVNNITINSQYLQQMPQEFADSLQQFVARLNAEFQQENISAETAAPVQNTINQLAEATTTLKDGIDDIKKQGIHEKLKAVAKALVKASPKIARIILGFTPLAPFSGVIGDTFESMVNASLQ